MAAKAGQISQIELLLVYGANPCVVDVKGKTPIDYAKEANFTDIVERLIESQYELSDSLTYFVCGRLPDHKNGQHFLLPEMIDFNHRSQDSKLKLQTLSNRIFEELSRDLFDEVDRRQIDAIFNTIHSDLSGQNIDRQVVPFLPVNPNFSATRNQGRQKLARLNNKEFAQLIVDILFEIRRRLYGMNQIGVKTKNMKTLSINNSQKKINRNESQISDSSSDCDSEPLYDSVPSENEEEVPQDSDHKTKPNSGTSRSFALKSKAPKNAVTLDEYSLLKDQLCRSDSLIQELVLGNQDMRYEITRLQVMVQKLIDENAQLRAVVIPRSQTPTNMTDEVLRKTERITRRIQELLTTAQEGRHEK